MIINEEYIECSKITVKHSTEEKKYSKVNLNQYRIARSPRETKRMTVVTPERKKR